MLVLSCNCTIVNVRNKHIYHNNSHIKEYNAIKSSISNKKINDTNIYINVTIKITTLMIAYSIYMCYVLALSCNDIQYIYTFVIRECVSGNIEDDHGDGYIGELTKV